MLPSARFNLGRVGLDLRQSLGSGSEAGVMNIQSTLRAIRALAILFVASFAVSAPAYAHGGGGGGHGGGGGGHGGGSGHAGGFHGGGGGRGGFGGFHGGYGHRGGYGYGGWGWAGYGLFLSTLPYYYSTFWWDGMPYYYADDNYYQWNNSVGEYQSVNPPSQIANQVASQQTVTDLFAYPKNGQSTEQQAQDKQECRSWAAAQTGFDRTQSGTASASALTVGTASPAKREDYLRAQAACFEARGYSVK
jgi:hypothetical protein